MGAGKVVARGVVPKKRNRSKNSMFYVDNDGNVRETKMNRKGNIRKPKAKKPSKKKSKVGLLRSLLRRRVSRRRRLY